jgi:hypothetical protein
MVSSFALQTALCVSFYRDDEREGEKSTALELVPSMGTNQAARRWYRRPMAEHPRVQVTMDPELAEALRAAAEHLNPEMSVPEQIRHLAIIGARSFPEWTPTDEETRRREWERFDEMLSDPEGAGLDWDLLRRIVDARHLR